MNNYYNQTMKNLEKHLKTTANSFKKLDGSSSEGFIYEKDGVFFNARIDRHIKFFILDAYKGITLANKAFAPAVSRYCQEAVTRIGSLQLDADHDEVYFHVESPFIDNAVTPSTFAVCEEEAIKTLNKHYSVLDDLCHGKLLARLPVEQEEAEKFIDFDKIKPTLEAIETYLSEKSNHNVVAKNISATSDKVFQCEIMTHTDRFRLDIIVAAAKDFVTFKVYNGTEGVFIAEPYRYMASQFCNEKSDEKKVGCIGIEPDTGKIYCKVNVSLLDGVIEGNTIEDCEQVALGILHQCKGELEMISHGILPIDEDEKKPSMEDMFKKLSSGSNGLPFMGRPHSPSSDDFDVDALIKRIDAKIASLSEELEADNDSEAMSDDDIDALSALLSGDDAEAV